MFKLYNIINIIYKLYAYTFWFERIPHLFYLIICLLNEKEKQYLLIEIVFVD